MSDLELDFTNHSDNGTELVGNTDNQDDWNRDYILQLKTQRNSGAVTAVRATGGGRGHGLHGIGGRLGGAGLLAEAGGTSGVTGIIGIGSRFAGVGVHGFGGEGVDSEGNATGIGVRGISSIGIVGAIADNEVAEEPCGIFGSALGTLGYTGIVGRSDLGIGIEGTSLSLTGVQGRSDGAGTGVRGVSAGGVGVSGVTTEGTGVLGVAIVPSKNRPRTSFFRTGMAGHFIGKVLIEGDLAVTGAKSAVVPTSDGKHKVLYCVESPESWFEDFGEAKLKRGSASVLLSEDFAELIARKKYHVFLTPNGACAGLFVVKRTSRGFHVREANGGTSSVAFSFRIVAKRKDLEAHRLREVNLAPLPKPSLSKARRRKAGALPKLKKGAKRITRPKSKPRPEE